MEKSISQSVSAIHGPPGTGKSQVASRIVWSLLQMSTDEKILCSTPANVAIDSLLLRCEKECTELGIRNLKFARVWSLSQTKAQYSNRMHTVLEQPYHIEKLRLDIARKGVRERWAQYLEGHNTLINHGVINNPEVNEQWSKDTAILTRLAMDDARVAFSTTAALSSTALKYSGGEKGETMTWGPATWILDEAGQANADAILLGLVTFARSLKRFIMVGDHLQLPGFTGSDLARKVFKKSFLETFVNRGFPSVLLNVQFRALEVCMRPINNGKTTYLLKIAKLTKDSRIWQENHFRVQHWQPWNPRRVLSYSQEQLAPGCHCWNNAIRAYDIAQLRQCR